MVVTVPLGVLKHGDISFKPPLPLRKLQAIQRVGFGVLNKVSSRNPGSDSAAAQMCLRIACDSF